MSSNPGTAASAASTDGVNGFALAGYRHEPGVDPNGTTETYVAMKLFIDNWRWQGVPFYAHRQTAGQAHERGGAHLP